MTDCRFSRLLAKTGGPAVVGGAGGDGCGVAVGCWAGSVGHAGCGGAGARTVLLRVTRHLVRVLRQIMPTLVLAALAAAGRILFGPIPDFKPVSAIAIIAGATLGRRNGFIVGALAALTSNFFLDRACGRRGRCMPGGSWDTLAVRCRMRVHSTAPMAPCVCRRY